MVPEWDKRVLLIFKREELLYDCSNIAWVEGDVLPAEDTHRPHVVQDIAEDGNVDWVTRVLTLGVSQCREWLYPYTKKSVEACSGLDDELEEPSAWTIELCVPDDFSQTTVTLLEHLIHHYLVYLVLEQWMRVSNVDNARSADNWRARVEETAIEIKDALNARTGRTRITMAMF